MILSSLCSFSTPLLSSHELIWNDEVERFGIEQLKSADMLVFGGVTYEGMAAYWPNADNAEGETAKYMNSLPKVVCSRTRGTADWNNTIVVKDAALEIPKLKQQGDGNMFVFGSGNLSETLINENLFDEYRLLIAPVFLGKGRLLFNQGLKHRKLKLLEARPLSTGGVILRYGWMSLMGGQNLTRRGG